MFALSLIWLGVGIVVGALALAARLRPALWGRRGWLVMLGVGAVSGLVGGWLGALVFGRYFGTATALWVSVLVIVAASWLTNRAVRRVEARRRPAAP